MEHRAAIKNLFEEEIVQCDAPPDVLRGAHYNINGLLGVDLLEDFHRFADPIPTKRHDNKEVNVRIIASGTAGIRAKENHSLRPKFPDDTVGELPDLGKRNHEKSIHQQASRVLPTSSSSWRLGGRWHQAGQEWNGRLLQGRTWDAVPTITQRHANLGI